MTPGPTFARADVSTICLWQRSRLSLRNKWECCMGMGEQRSEFEAVFAVLQESMREIGYELEESVFNRVLPICRTLQLDNFLNK